MGQNTLPIVEVDYYNCIVNKKILTPQPANQTGSLTVPGSTGVAADNVFPICQVFAPPYTLDSPYGLGNPFATDKIASVVFENFYTEEMYIRGGFNNSFMSLGVKAYLDEEEPLQQHRFNALIYSGVFNSRTGINRTNQFPVGENITKAANPQNGSIQKIYAEQNNLIVLQENKCSRALIDKDAIYNAEGGGSVVTANNVIGEIVPYVGQYGISKNPESFAIYSFRKYFIDRNRNAVLRLSNDGITEISEYGMRDWFRDNLKVLDDEYTNSFEIILKSTTSNNPSASQSGPSYINNGISPIKQFGVLGSKVFFEYGNSGDYIDMNCTFIGVREEQTTNDYMLLSRVITQAELTNITNIKLLGNYRSRVYGGYDAYNKQYILSIQPNNSKLYTQPNTPTVPKPDNTYYTLGYDHQVKGWPSFYSYKSSFIGSLKNTFYTINNDYWNEGNTLTIQKGLYSHYATSVPHGQFYSIDHNSNVTIVANANPSLQKAFLAIDYEGDSGWQAEYLTSDRTGQSVSREVGGVWNNSWQFNSDNADLIYSYVQGAYDSLGNTGTSANPNNAPLLRAGFDRKENRYVSNVVNKSTAAPGEINFGNKMSGVKGYYLDIKFTTDNVTAPGGMKELYSVGVTYNISST